MANSVVKLTIDSQEFDANIKRAGEALNKFFDQAKKGDRTFEVLDDDAMEVVKAFGKMETSSKSARGQLSELTKGFTDFSLIYKRLTDEEKASPAGKEMAKSLGELKARIQDTKKDLADIGQELSGSKFGQFGGVIDTIGHKLGLTANATELLTSKTALMYAGIGAGIAIIGKASDAWAKYNRELAKQDQITTVTTGLKGTEADHMTDVMRALSDTYKVDFREAVNAANTLMTQFGVNGDEAIRLIKDGMQGMIQGDGPKLLQMIKQYAPAFRDAGVSASQLVAVIHNSEGGIFTDQNMNAIVMGMKNIRLMTKQTSDALFQLGIDGKKMSHDLNAGTITVFDALKQVAGELKNVDSNSQAAGQVMQAVFGRQGITAGTNIAKAIETLNTNLEETKKQTGELGDAFAELQTANEHLNTAIRDAFSYDGWAEMATGIKSTLIDTLADVIDKLGTIKGLLAGISPSQAKQKKYGTSGTPDEVKRDLEALSNADTSSREAMYQSMLQKYERRFQDATRQMQSEQSKFDAGNRGNFVQRYNPLGIIGQWWQSTNVNTARSNVVAEQDVMSLFRKEAAKILNPEPAKPEPPKPPFSPTGNTNTKITTAKELNPMQQAQKKISDLTNEALTADDERLGVIRKEVAALNEQLKVYKEIQDYVSGKTPNFNVTVGDRKAFEAEQMRRLNEELGISKNAFTEKNASSFISDLKSQIQTADLGSELYNNLTKQLADTNAIGNLMQTAIKNGIDISQFNPQDLWNKVFGQNPGDYITDEQLEEIRKKIEEIIGKPIKLDVNTGNVSGEGSGGSSSKETGSKYLSQISGGISSMTSSIEQLGIQVPEGLKAVVGGIQAVTSILTAISTIMSAIEALSAAGSIPFFANGGIIPHAANGYFVPGTHYSGDVTPIMANAGELVLSRAQQSNLASTLSQRDESGYGGTPYVSGEQIFLGLNNYLRRSGRGELITARG